MGWGVDGEVLIREIYGVRRYLEYVDGDSIMHLSEILFLQNWRTSFVIHETIWCFHPFFCSLFLITRGVMGYTAQINLVHAHPRN